MESQEVVQSKVEFRDGGSAAGGRRGWRMVVSAGVGPFVQGGLNEALGLPLVRGVKRWRRPKERQVLASSLER